MGRDDNGRDLWACEGEKKAQEAVFGGRYHFLCWLVKSASKRSCSYTLHLDSLLIFSIKNWQINRSNTSRSNCTALQSADCGVVYLSLHLLHRARRRRHGGTEETSSTVAPATAIKASDVPSATAVVVVGASGRTLATRPAACVAEWSGAPSATSLELLATRSTDGQGGGSHVVAVILNICMTHQSGKIILLPYKASSDNICRTTRPD